MFFVVESTAGPFGLPSAFILTPAALLGLRPGLASLARGGGSDGGGGGGALAQHRSAAEIDQSSSVARLFQDNLYDSRLRLAYG